MLRGRKTSYILLLINLILVFFVIIRAGSEKVESKSVLSQPVKVRVLDQPPVAVPDTLVLNDFEKVNDRMNMYDQGGEFKLDLSGEHVTHGSRSLNINKQPESNIELATVHYPRQWQYYDALELDVFNASEGEATLWLRIGSQYDARRFYTTSQKFKRAFALAPGANTIRIPVTEIAEAFGRLPKRKSIHLNFPGDGGTAYYLDFLRMVRHDG